jgi:flagellar hook-basal body complex protein FliE
MSTTILPIRSPNFPAIEPLPSVKPGSGAAGTNAPSSFSDLLSSSIGTVEQATQSATNAAQQFLSGENEDLHTVAIAEQKAEITSELFLQLRNKAISAYQEIMKMQL